MTKNQIEYAKLLEEKRANVARETETRRANVAQESLTRSRDAISLDISARSQAEQARHNVASEAITQEYQRAQIAETQRSNLAREVELHRANVAQETELQRSHQASEAIGRTQAAAATKQAEAALRQAAARESEVASSNQYRSQQINLGYAQIEESRRASQARELENQRHNLMVESQTSMAQQIDLMEATTKRMQQQELERHNKRSEILKAREIDTGLGKSIIGLAPYLGG